MVVVVVLVLLVVVVVRPPLVQTSLHTKAEMVLLAVAAVALLLLLALEAMVLVVLVATDKEMEEIYSLMDLLLAVVGEEILTVLLAESL